MKRNLSLILLVVFFTLFMVPQVYASEDSIEAFVTRLYNLCFDRQPDQGGLNYWIGELAAKKRTGADVAFHFVFSNEFLDKDFSDGEYLEVLYRVFFNREPDVAGKNFWHSKLNEGYSRRYVLANFINSKEFGAICEKFNITAGNIDVSNKDLPEKREGTFGNPDSIFSRSDIDRLTNIDSFAIKNKTIYFDTGESSNYKLQETLNPDINKQVYELTKNLITDGLYVRTDYYDYQNKYVSVMFAATETLARWGSDIFTFYFQEKDLNVDPYGYYNEYIGVSMSSLIYDGVDYSPKLKIAFITVFGEEEGTKLFDFAYDCFNKYGSWEDRKKEIRLTEEFDTVKATYVQQGRFFTNDCSLHISKK